MQKHWFQPRLFRKYSQPITFPQSKNLWYIYKPASPDHTQPYALSLSRKSLGWIEVGLKNQKINKDSDLIIDQQRNLELGRYLLRIAYENEVLDSITFQIVPGEGQAEIDYDAPIAQTPENNEVIDDIVLYSK